MKSYSDLLEGYKNFRQEYQSVVHQEYREKAAESQHPQVMVIGCSDSRINPAVMTKAGLGDLFMVRNVANIVPPSDANFPDYGTMSAVEFAVKHLKIKHVIVIGHSNCGGVKALLSDIEDTDEGYKYIKPWVQIAANVKQDVLSELKNAPEAEQQCVCEKNNVINSLKNLASYDYIQDAVKKETLYLHAWYYNLSESELYEYDQEQLKFKAIV